jgi:hypothetical protein
VDCESPNSSTGRNTLLIGSSTFGDTINFKSTDQNIHRPFAAGKTVTQAMKKMS